MVTKVLSGLHYIVDETSSVSEVDRAVVRISFGMRNPRLQVEAASDIATLDTFETSRMTMRGYVDTLTASDGTRFELT